MEVEVEMEVESGEGLDCSRVEDAEDGQCDETTWTANGRKAVI